MGVRSTEGARRGRGIYDPTKHGLIRWIAKSMSFNLAVVVAFASQFSRMSRALHVYTMWVVSSFARRTTHMRTVDERGQPRSRICCIASTLSFTTLFPFGLYDSLAVPR